MLSESKIFIAGLLIDEFQKLCEQWGFEAYRAKQILDWIYHKSVLDPSKMTNLPQPLLKRLQEETQICNLEVVEKAHSHTDKSVKYLFRLSDGELVEAVWMPQKGFKTICLSTQVGCPLKCSFCASGQVRYKRNLKVHEMIGQILSIQTDLKRNERPGHIVFMGMGEPLLNFENLLKTISILKEPWGFGIGARKITVSTAGYVPGIIKWSKAPKAFQQVRLSISLHATHDAARDQIMPINQKYSVRDLVSAIETYCRQTGRKVTFEYLLLKGINDGNLDSKELAQLAKGLAHSVNVIEYNEVKGTGLERSPRGEIFMSELKRHGVEATYRRSKGRDIEAACGQLRGKFVEERKNLALLGRSELAEK